MSVGKVYLGLPAYNEEKSIQPLFEKIKLLKNSSLANLHVVLYDDGCVDATKNEVRKWLNTFDITYLDGGVNKGLGTAMNELLAYFVDNAKPDDLLVIMDCDDTHDPAQIPEMIAALKANQNTNLVIASRYRKGAFVNGVAFHRVLMSLGAAMLYKMVHPLKGARDYTCGYRLYTHELLVKAFNNNTMPLLKERGFSCTVELLLRLKAVGAKIVEVPLELSYDNKKSGSKMDVSGNAFRLLKKLLDWRIRGLAS